MRRLALISILALSACATAPGPKMSWAEAMGQQPQPKRPLLAMAGRGLPAALPQYELGAVGPFNYGNQAAGGTCPFTVTTTSNSYTVACDGTLTIGTITYGVGGINLQGSGSVTNAVNVSAGNSITSNVNVVTPNVGTDLLSPKTAGNSVVLKGNQADGSSAVGDIIDNNVTLANAGAKLASVRNNATERFYIDVNGMPFAGLTLKPVVVDITNSAATAEQHGTGTCSANTLAVTYPTAFASGTPVVTGNATTASASAWNATSITNTGFTAKCAGATDTFNWDAKGLR